MKLADVKDECDNPVGLDGLAVKMKESIVQNGLHCYFKEGAQNIVTMR